MRPATHPSADRPVRERPADPSAETVFRSLGGSRTARGFLCRCPVPSHGQGRGDRNPSLFVTDGARRLMTTCFAGCSWQDIRAALESRDLTRAAEPVPREPVPPATTTADALALWREGLPVQNTLAARYAAARGLPSPPPSLRFLPDAPFSKTRLMPALIAAYSDEAGRGFRFEAGRHSEAKPATVPI